MNSPRHCADVHQNSTISYAIVFSENCSAYSKICFTGCLKTKLDSIIVKKSSTAR